MHFETNQTKVAKLKHKLSQEQSFRKGSLSNLLQEVYRRFSILDFTFFYEIHTFYTRIIEVWGTVGN